MNARALAIGALALGVVAGGATWWWGTHVDPALRATRVAVRGPIDAGLVARITAVLDAARGPVLLCIDSSGGDTRATTTLVDAIEHAQRRSIWVGGFVEGRAHGWAALVALACDDLTCTPDAEIGKARPFPLPTELPEDVQRNLLTQSRASFELVATRRRRNVDTARAMVVNDLALSGRDAVAYRIADGTAADADAALHRIGAR